jgi:hypothetical protein
MLSFVMLSVDILNVSVPSRMLRFFSLNVSGEEKKFYNMDSSVSFLPSPAKILSTIDSRTILLKINE